jgi:hypothetical protein
VDDFWWAMLITMLYIPFLFLWGFTLFDMAFRKDLHAWSKLLWALFILFIPLIGVLVYFITRPKDYDAWAPTPAMYGSSGGYYAPPAAAQTAQMMPPSDIDALSHMHDEGKLSDSEYESLKQRLSPA